MNVKEYQAKYRSEHLEHRREVARRDSKAYYQKYRQRKLEYSKNRRKQNVLSWVGFIDKETNCQICNKEIIFNNGNRSINSVHFDHRSNGREIINCRPYDWLMSHPCNDKNKAIWLSCNFGILCAVCNRGLPTKNRNQWLEAVIKYVGKSESLPDSSSLATQ